ncbi:MAG: class I SAM-dependent methyltransferase, partial [Actinomycetota bacterium]|nr:class I SAM-dependent methyltransferase [Actinomycetota bacterium]
MDTDPAGAARLLPEWDGARYAQNTAHHRAHDDRFLAPLALRGDERVVDVGCGSGDLTAKVAALVPDGHVVGVDPQPSMIELARSVAAANQTFALLAAQDLAAPGSPLEPSSADVVYSRATLHWV